MGHLAFDDKGKARAGTPDAWLPVAAQIATYARRFAGRGDIVANVGPEVGGPYATACWNPIVADMDVNTATCLPGYTPDRVDFHDEVFQLGAMPFVGAVTHEAAHAKWTCWVPKTLIDRTRAGAEQWSRATVEIVVALEESRIERLAVMSDPSKRDALAQCALGIVLDDFKVNNTLFGASISLALTVGRYAILSPAEVARFRALIEPHLPLGLMPQLESLIREYHALPTPLAKEGVPSDAFFARMLSIAERWLIAIRETAAKIEAAEEREAKRRAEREEREAAEREAAEPESSEDDETAETDEPEPAEDGDEPVEGDEDVDRTYEPDEDVEPEDEPVEGDEDADEDYADESEPEDSDESAPADEGTPADEGDESDDSGPDDDDLADDGDAEPSDEGEPEPGDDAAGDEDYDDDLDERPTGDSDDADDDDYDEPEADDEPEATESAPAKRGEGAGSGASAEAGESSEDD